MSKRIKIEKITKIKQLRKQGFSIPEISSSINLPKTTVFYHARSVKMPNEIIKEWKAKRGGSRKIMLFKEKQASEKAQKFVKNFSERENILFISALYWAEGNKKDFMLSNTDSNLIKVYLNGLREVFKITNDRLRISIRIYEDMNKEKCLDYWSNITNIPKESFQNVYVLKGKKLGKLQYGMCRIRVTKGGDLLKEIMAINRNLAEKVAY